jgi:hypothetical protein
MTRRDKIINGCVVGKVNSKFFGWLCRGCGAGGVAGQRVRVETLARDHKCLSPEVEGRVVDHVNTFTSTVDPAEQLVLF